MKMRQRKKKVQYRPLVTFTLSKENAAFFNGMTAAQREALVTRIFRVGLKEK